MAVPAEQLMTWAARHAPDRIAAVGVLALRPRRYFSDGVPLGRTPIPGLMVRVPAREETPTWHQSTGLYGFLRLPPGTARVEVSDPAGRYLPQALTVAVPDRQSVRVALEAGEVPSANAPRPLYLDVALRPAIDFAVPPGTAAIWGVVRGRDDRRPVPGALVGLDTVRTGVADRVTSMSGPDGCYLLVLPGEAIDRGVAPPVRRFDRRLSVEVPRPPLAAALAGPQGYLKALPTDVFGLSDADRNGLFQVRDFRLRPAFGALREPVNDQNPLTTVSIGERVRWDIELFP